MSKPKKLLVNKIWLILLIIYQFLNLITSKYVLKKMHSSDACFCILCWLERIERKKRNLLSSNTLRKVSLNAKKLFVF